MKHNTHKNTKGVGFFGAEPASPSNIIIRNGKLGLTSHHGILGLENNKVLLENLEIYDFETHGIQLNGFNDVIIKNVDIGPSSTIAYLKGEYLHARIILPRLYEIAQTVNEVMCHYFV